VIVVFADIGVIVDHHCLNFLYIMTYNTLLDVLFPSPETHTVKLRDLNQTPGT
jgi:hypothetical protein